MNRVNTLLSKKYDSKYWKIGVCIYMITAAYLILFQSFRGLTSDDLFYSDFPAHLNVTSHSWYSLYHFPVLIANYIGGYRGAAIASLIVILCCDFLCIYSIRKYFAEKISNRYIVDFLSVAVLLVSMIIIVFRERWYVGIGTPNPWHTPTYRVAKPFSILSFYYFLRLYENLHLKIDGYKKDLALFSVFSMLSCAAKPSFMLAAAPAYIVMLFYQLIKEKFACLMDCIYVGLSLLPGGLVILFQNYITFQAPPSGDTSHVRFGINDVWSSAWVLKYHSMTGVSFIDGAVCFAITIFLAAGFPLFVSLVQARSLKLSQKCSLLIYLFATFFNLFAYEDGFRKYHGNFGWSYLYALLFLFISALEGLLCNPPENKKVKAACWILFYLHLISGIIYYIKVLCGFLYY
ncbi:MAG: hypothetical protein IJM51_01350 [Clostridia bacterium]|nr:hypothetical protein [Clostridia bacterium]